MSIDQHTLVLFKKMDGGWTGKINFLGKGIEENAVRTTKAAIVAWAAAYLSEALKDD